MTARPKATRDDRQHTMNLIVNALLDKGYASSLTVHVVQHGNDSDAYYDYITVNMGEIKQDKYEALCKTVNGFGGVVMVMDIDRLSGEKGNIRISPYGADDV